MEQGLPIETEKFYNFHATWRDSRERVVVYIKSAVNLLENSCHFSMTGVGCLLLMFESELCCVIVCRSLTA